MHRNNLCRAYSMSLSKKWLAQTTYVLFTIVAVAGPSFATIATAKHSDQSIGDILPYPHN